MTWPSTLLTQHGSWAHGDWEHTDESPVIVDFDKLQVE